MCDGLRRVTSSTDYFRHIPNMNCLSANRMMFLNGNIISLLITYVGFEGVTAVVMKRSLF